MAEFFLLSAPLTSRHGAGKLTGLERARAGPPGVISGIETRGPEAILGPASQSLPKGEVRVRELRKLPAAPPLYPRSSGHPPWVLPIIPPAPAGFKSRRRTRTSEWGDATGGKGLARPKCPRPRPPLRPLVPSDAGSRAGGRGECKKILRWVGGPGPDALPPLLWGSRFAAPRRRTSQRAEARRFDVARPHGGAAAPPAGGDRARGARGGVEPGREHFPATPGAHPGTRAPAGSRGQV